MGQHSPGCAYEWGSHAYLGVGLEINCSEQRQDWCGSPESKRFPEGTLNQTYPLGPQALFFFLQFSPSVKNGEEPVKNKLKQLEVNHTLAKNQVTSHQLHQ